MAELGGDRVRLVACDFDDTLVGTHEAIWALHKHLARTYYGLELTDDILATHWGRPLPELAHCYY